MSDKQIKQLRDIGETRHTISLCGEGALKAGRVIDALQISCREAANTLEDNKAAIAELVEALEEGHDLIKGDLVEGHWKRACRKFTTNASALIAKHKAGE